MKQIDDAVSDRIERGELHRALSLHEKKAAELRGRLGLLLRPHQNVEPAKVEPDGLTRMRTDQIDRLYEAGRIDANRRAAALKYRTVYEAMSRGLFRAGGGFEITGTKSRGKFRHPLERMNETELFIWFKEYKPWADAHAAKIALQQGAWRISFQQICYSVIVDGFGPSQLEKTMPIPRGKGLVTQALAEVLGRWTHLDYTPDTDLQEMRTAVVAASHERIEEARPKKSRNP